MPEYLLFLPFGKRLLIFFLFLSNHLKFLPNQTIRSKLLLIHRLALVPSTFLCNDLSTNDSFLLTYQIVYIVHDAFSYISFDHMHAILFEHFDVLHLVPSKYNDNNESDPQ